MPAKSTNNMYNFLFVSSSSDIVFRGCNQMAFKYSMFCKALKPPQFILSKQ